MDKEQLQQALAKIDVETYLDQEGITYSHSYGTRGLQLNLHQCPACGEGGRKTYINAETGLGNCFHGSCGFKFNKFKLIQKVSGLGGADLLAHIASTAENQGWLPKKERVELKRGALALPSKLLPIPDAHGRNLRYLEDRGITAESAAWFQLQLCRGGWWGYELADGSKKWVSYDRRVVIPIADLDGVLVSFQGRDITGEQEPKYLFPVGFAVAGSHLYNGQNFRDGVHTHAVVGEGAFDAIAIHQALQGHASCNSMIALATFGMHLSSGPGGQIDKFIQLKQRGLRSVTMMWDAERKAMTMAVKAGLQLASLGLTVQIARLPDGKDPNEATPEQVRQAIFRATHLTRISAIKLMHEAGSIAG